MNRLLIAIVGGGAHWILGLVTSLTEAQDNAQKATGSIKGQITASGVRDTENVLVYVEKAPGEFPPPKDPATMDQQKLTFVPNVLPILKGTKVKFNNSDPVLHNVFWNKSDGRIVRSAESWNIRQGCKCRIYVRQGRLRHLVVQRSSGNGRAHRGAAESVFCLGEQGRRLRDQGSAARPVFGQSLVPQSEEAQGEDRAGDGNGRRGDKTGLFSEPQVKWQSGCPCRSSNRWQTPSVDKHRNKVELPSRRLLAAANQMPKCLSGAYRCPRLRARHRRRAFRRCLSDRAWSESIGFDLRTCMWRTV